MQPMILARRSRLSSAACLVPLHPVFRVKQYELAYLFLLALAGYGSCSSNWKSRMVFFGNLLAINTQQSYLFTVHPPKLKWEFSIPKAAIRPSQL
ncbi:hypothetical protein NC651_005068 [Populus alba x Populus x berolinensis]|nr:hypothetical protein NC651_005068 [Populus alba x Populus x berolinensis]